MSKHLIPSFLALAGSLALAVPQSAIGQEVERGAVREGSVTGRWTLNRALSDDPADQMRNARGGAVRPSGGGRPGPSGGGSTFDTIRRAVEGFGIEQTDSTVTIAYPGGDLSLFTDGRKQKIASPDGREVDCRTVWDGPVLVVERALGGGMSLTEKYSVQGRTGRLHVLTRLAGDRLPTPIAFMRVYDRAPASGDPVPAGAGDPESPEDPESPGR